MEYIIVWILMVMQPANYDSVMGEIAYPLEFTYDTREECKVAQEVAEYAIEFDGELINDEEYLICITTRLYEEEG